MQNLTVQDNATLKQVQIEVCVNNRQKVPGSTPVLVSDSAEYTGLVTTLC